MIHSTPNSPAPAAAAPALVEGPGGAALVAGPDCKTRFRSQKNLDMTCHLLNDYAFRLSYVGKGISQSSARDVAYKRGARTAPAPPWARDGCSRFVAPLANDSGQHPSARWSRCSVDSEFTFESIDILLQAFALMVMGTPMCRVQRLVGIKAQTVKKKLLSILESDRWEELKMILEWRFRLPGSYIFDFECVIVSGVENGRADFLDWAKELRRQEYYGQGECARLASRILRRPVKISEITAWGTHRRRRP
jgi:hypothetical protein